MSREISWLNLFFLLGYAACQGGIGGETDTISNSSSTAAAAEESLKELHAPSLVSSGADLAGVAGGSAGTGGEASIAEVPGRLVDQVVPFSDAGGIPGSSFDTGVEVADAKDIADGSLIPAGDVADAGLIPGFAGSSLSKIAGMTGAGAGSHSPESGNIVGILQVLTVFYGTAGSTASTAQESTSNTQASNGVSSFTKEVSPSVSSIVKSIKKLLNAMQMSGLKALLELLNKFISAARNKASIEKTLEDKMQKPVKDIVNIILGRNEKLRVVVIIDVISLLLDAILKLVIRFS